MADSTIQSNPLLRLNPAITRALNDVLGGAAASILTVTLGLSYAVLIFAGPLAPYLSTGVGVTFMASAILALVLGLGSSLRFAIAAPEASTAAMTGIVASSLVERITEADPTAPLLAPVIITFGLVSIATGLMLCTFGVTRIGRTYPIQWSAASWARPAA
ncbi:sulfate permease, SulP family [Bradyrhizobium sp. Ghvi]|nr:sulfate permease, SulP family [Bradyrhizobium sp. Ghvi]